jgi:DEAD/DEAH box helicase domain-containing protein
VIATGTASGKSLVFQTAALAILEKDPEARVAVFYPLKALAADQLVGWKKALVSAGYSETLVAECHGDIEIDARFQSLEEARVLIMTPDVCHHWLLKNLVKLSVKRFISNIQLIVIDEAHVLEGVFGSHVAFLLRRLQVARAIAQKGRVSTKKLRFVAASATISNPDDHLKALTGRSFSVVDESQDGSPAQSRSLVHLACKTNPASILPELQQELLQSSTQGSFISFVDSRQGVERAVVQTNHPLVRPYRSGYEADDRISIENALRNGALRGVVSTSALELGINIPHFAIGLNAGVPNSRKAFRQRFGRVGRAQPGSFAVIADPNDFRRFGSTFAEYWNGSIEPSTLYLKNRFMQFTHARCLVDELEMLGVMGKAVVPSNIEWPSGFNEAFEYARPGGVRPREFDQIAAIGGDSPHLNYPIRNIAEGTFSIAQNQHQRVGSVTLQQAIREAYPGAIYLHLARGYKVLEWRNTAWERTIHAYPVNTDTHYS